MAEKAKKDQKLSAEGPRIEHLLNKLKLEELDSFVGVLDKKCVEMCLIAKGFFAIRAEDHGSFCEVILSVRWTNQIHHITVLHNKSCTFFSLTAGEGALKFPSIREMISHYLHTGLNIDGKKISLTKPAKRPMWLLKNTDVEFTTASENKLGAGNFCVVYRGKLRRHGDLISVAVKVCKHTIEERKTQEEIEQEDKARMALIQEGQLMRSVRHPNVIKFYGIAFDTVPVKIVMELCCGGSVQKHLETFTDKIGTPERIKYARESATGLEYLHSKNIVHRDLAVRNILISHQGVAKLADFGLSAFVEDLTGGSFGREHMPVRWMAPESVQRDAYFVTKSDVWSFGVVLYEIFMNGAKIFDQWQPKRIATHIRKGKMPTLSDRFPPSVKTLIEQQCWVVDLNQRATMEAVKKELDRIQKEFPLPPMSQLTLNKIPGVTALTDLEIELYRECGIETPIEPCESQAEKPEPKHTPSPAIPRVSSIEDQQPKRPKAMSRRNRRDVPRECATQDNQVLSKEDDGKEVKAVRASRRPHQPATTPNRSTTPSPGPTTTLPTSSTVPATSTAATPPTPTM
ncbi:Tyrosine-protein kinase [Aphelenchoides besseyi]|nr:Tyrosine-protein kinase [Aphelenchoides besseyi]